MPYNPVHRTDPPLHYQLIDLLKETGKVEEAKFRFAHDSRSIWTDTDRISFTKWSWLNEEHDIQDYWEDRMIGW